MKLKPRSLLKNQNHTKKVSKLVLNQPNKQSGGININTNFV
ncbi:hypothetical protein RB653_007953 [Dictyostelium firmibasis]|uniref:Uncharacterized protein n=1 Tax=Dictyostelium firmibasis TaxID=79012 RepID=A0AAN7TPI1_9MYCE